MDVKIAENDNRDRPCLSNVLKDEDENARFDNQGMSLMSRQKMAERGRL